MLTSKSLPNGLEGTLKQALAQYIFTFSWGSKDQRLSLYMVYAYFLPFHLIFAHIPQFNETMNCFLQLATKAFKKWQSK